MVMDAKETALARPIIATYKQKVIKIFTVRNNIQYLRNILANFHIESVKSMLKFVYIINFKYVKVGMSIIFIAWSSCSAGIRLDSIPAPYENFLPSIEQKHDNFGITDSKTLPKPHSIFNLINCLYQNSSFLSKNFIGLNNTLHKIYHKENKNLADIIKRANGLKSIKLFKITNT